MNKVIVLLLVLKFGLLAGDSQGFQEQQTLLQNVKQVIIDEEAISRAYEQYIINELSLPANISTLATAQYLGVGFGVIDDELFNNFILNSRGLNYRLKDELKDNPNIKLMYESDTFRRNTFYHDNQVYFIFNNDFAKNIFNMVIDQGMGVASCSVLPARKYCTIDNHIYVYDDTLSDVLMYYHKDKYKTGPIIIINDSTKYDYDEFKSIPVGIPLYDFDGALHIKTPSSIERVK